MEGITLSCFELMPYYDPEEIYGSWWWPDYPPFVWYPMGTPYITVGLFGFGWGVGVSPFWGWGWGAWNWGSGNVYININRTVNINNPNLNLKRNSLRTTNLTSVAATRVAGPVRTAVERAGGRAVTSSGARAASGHEGHFSRQSTSNRKGVVSRRGSACRISAAPSNTAHKSSAASLGKELHGDGGRTSTGNMARKTGGPSKTTGNVSHRGLSNRDRDIVPRSTFRSESMSRGGATQNATQHMNSGSSLSSGDGGRGVSPGETMHNGSFSGTGTRTGGGHVAGVPAGGGGHPTQSGESPHKRYAQHGPGVRNMNRGTA